jgi:23S rRNA (pseudouridine1915-N3)-methyltransferase
MMFAAITLNRIKHYVKAKVKIINVSSSAIAAAPQPKKEAAAILEKLSDRDSLILLDDKGRQFSSEEFAVQLNKLFNSGKSKIVMVNRRCIWLSREPSEKSFHEALIF